MNFDLTDDQIALRDGIRSLVEGRFPMSRVREGFDRTVHAELAEAGVFSLRADGFCWADAAVVYEELGRGLVPGPLSRVLRAHGESPRDRHHGPAASICRVSPDWSIDVVDGGSGVARWSSPGDLGPAMPSSGRSIR